MLRRSMLLAMAAFLAWSTTLSAQTVAGTDLYAVDLETGALTRVGEIGSGEAVIGLALLTGTFDTGPALALTSDNELFEFNTSSPGALGDRLEISGLQSGESLKGIDYRPATDELWAISDQSRLYVLDLGNGEATLVGDGFEPALDDPNVGFDFNPTVDRIRVGVLTGQNLRLNPETGDIGRNPDTDEPTIDGDLAYAEGDVNAGIQPKVVGAAYTNSQADAAKTELYVIDVATQSLALQQPPNAGVLNTVGPLGVDIVEWAAFDISPAGDAFVTNPNLIDMPSTGSGSTSASSIALPWEIAALAGAAFVTMAAAQRLLALVRTPR